MERIQKILAAGGLASRRAAERLITEGRVRVNGVVVAELGAKADAHKDRIEVDGKRVVAERRVYLVVHKPRGVVATMSDPEGRPTVREILAPVGARVYPVGRLDFATSGVLLATNDGDFAEGLLHPKRAVPKTYVVKVNGKMTAEDMDRWRAGVRLEDGMTAPAEAKTLRFEGDKTWFELTIKEGRNQQIRRMGEATGFAVMRLARLSFATVTAEGLRPGAWRHMTREELVQLKKTYGVPRSIPAPTEKVVESARRARAVHSSERSRGRAEPTGSDERSRVSGGTRAPRDHASRSRSSSTNESPQRASARRVPGRYAGEVAAESAKPARGPNTHRGGRREVVAESPKPARGPNTHRSGRHDVAAESAKPARGPNTHRSDRREVAAESAKPARGPKRR